MLVAVSGGIAVIVTVITARLVQADPTLTVTVYKPSAAVVIFGITGFCSVELNELGPAQLYTTPAVASLENNFSVSPAQILGVPGELLEAVGATGVESTTTVIVDIADGQPLSVAITEYVPVASVFAGLIDGFCSPDAKPFGPVQLKVDPAVLVAVKSSAVPEHTGELLVNTGAGGV